jgi:hypothetical protein
METLTANILVLIACIVSNVITPLTAVTAITAVV